MTCSRGCYYSEKETGSKMTRDFGLARPVFFSQAELCLTIRCDGKRILLSLHNLAQLQD